MNLLENDMLYSLQRLARLFATAVDNHELFNICRKETIRLIPCDLLVFFFYDSDKENFSAPFAYNALPDFPFHDFIPDPDPDSPLQRMLQKQEILLHESVTAPLFSSMRRELYLPIISQQKFYGAIYLGRRSEDRFEPREILLGELIAYDLASPIQRMDQSDRLNLVDQSASLWRQNYANLLEAIPFPTVLTDFATETFVDANQDFLTLVGLNHQELANSIIADVLGPIQVPKKCDFPLLLRGQLQSTNRPIEVLASLYDRKRPQNHLLVVLPEDLYQTVSPDSLVQILQPLLQGCRSEWKAETMTADFYRAASSALELLKGACLVVRIAQPQVETAAIACQSEAMRAQVDRLAEYGPAQRVLEKNSAVYLSQITEQSADPNWATAARECGFVSMAAVPILQPSFLLGSLIFFDSKVHRWSDKEKNMLHLLADIFSFLLKKRQVLQSLQFQIDQIAGLRAIVQIIANEMNDEESVQALVVQLRKVIDFDYFSLTIFETASQATLCYDIAARSVHSTLGADCHWQPIEKSEMGWVRRKDAFVPKLEPLIRTDRLPFSMPSHTSLLVLGKTRYYGNLALGRINDRPFGREEIEYLKIVAKHLAVILGRTDLFKRLERQSEKQTHFFTEAMQIGGQLQAEKIQEASRQAIQAIFQPDQIHLHHLDEDYFKWLPENLREFMVPERIEHLTEQLYRDRSAVLFVAPRDFCETLCDKRALTTEFDRFQPFALIPLPACRGDVLQIMAVSWPSSRQFTDQEIEFFQLIANSTLQALENAEMFQHAQETVDNQKEFIRMLSHDLRTPLQSIKSFTSLLQEENKSHDLQHLPEYLQRIDANLNQVQTLMNELGECQQFDEESLRFERIDLNRLFKDLLGSLSGQLLEKRIQVEIQSDLPEVLADRSALMHVFNNLLTNAIKAVEKQSQPKVEIGCREMDIEYHIFVRDNGMGLPAGLEEKIFQPFFKSSDLGFRSETGLGLAIADKLVRRHNGRIWSGNHAGGGAVFTVSLCKETAAAAD